MFVKKYEEENLSKLFTEITGVKTTIQQVKVFTDDGKSFKVVPTDALKIDPKLMLLMASGKPRRK